MSLKTYARKLRAAVEALEELFAEEGTRAKAKGILRSVKKSKHQPVTPKGFKYNGTHWTQKPENKAKVARIAKLAHKARSKNVKAAKAAGV
jgi:hypothetical protein